jgi:hypothetical protein
MSKTSQNRRLQIYRITLTLVPRTWTRAKHKSMNNSRVGLCRCFCCLTPAKETFPMDNIRKQTAATVPRGKSSRALRRKIVHDTRGKSKRCVERVKDRGHKAGASDSDLVPQFTSFDKFGLISARTGERCESRETKCGKSDVI